MVLPWPTHMTQARRWAPPAGDPGLLIGAQNALLCYDPRSGLQRWSVPFDSPLVAAFPGGSATNMLPGAHFRVASTSASKRWSSSKAGLLPATCRPVFLCLHRCYSL